MRPYMRAANVTWNGINIDDVKEMDFSPKEFETYELKDGDILLSEASGSASEVGKPAVWRGEVDGCCFQNTLIRVRSRGPLPEYLHLHFLADARLGRFAAVGKGIGINHLGADRMSSWPTMLPPVNEQRRLVTKVGALQVRSRRARKALDAVPPLLEKLRQSILAAAFRGDLTKDWRAQHKDVEPASKLLERIRAERRKKWEEAEFAKLKARGKAPKGDEWKEKYKEPEPVDSKGLPMLPEGWCWASLDELAVVVGGVTKGQQRNGTETLRHVPYLRVANVQRGHLNLDEVKTIEATEEEVRELRLFPGDILLNEGGDRDKLGRGWVWEGQLPECIHQNHVFRARLVSANIQPRYVSHYANQVGQNFFIDQGKQTTNLASVSMSRVRRLPIALPPAEEQTVMVRLLDERLAEASRLEVTLKGATEQVGAMERSTLGKAFRGALVPQDPNDEPAEVMLARIRGANGVTANGHAAKGAKTKGRTTRGAPDARAEES
jgi:type I restriction enzyme S subunit